MATTVSETIRPGSSAPVGDLPVLEQGDQLSRYEFERRYERMPEVKKAELIEGTVFMASPIRALKHAEPHHNLGLWLGTFAIEVRGIKCFDNPTVRLDLDNEPQPDLALLKLPEKQGQARISPDDYIEGAPELVVEIVGSTHAYDLHQKKTAYRRNGVREYLAWITGEKRVVWWQLAGGDYVEIQRDSDNFLKSQVFPGLWLDAPALLAGDMKAVLAGVRRGLESLEGKAFASSPQ